MHPPEWLNEEFLAASLEEEGTVSVTVFKCAPAVTKGNNNFSSLFRVNAMFTNEEDPELLKEVSFIVKAPVTGEWMEDLANKMHVVEKEIFVYKELLPELEKYLEDDTLTPRSFYSPREDVLVLEDLCEKGYIMCDRMKQLDHNHCVHVMRTLAKFHATSVALHEKNPAIVEEAGRKYVFTEDITPKNREFFSAMFKKNLISTAKTVNTFQGYERFSEKILQQVDTLWEKMTKMSSKKKHIKVLNHGDLWTNNILFRHDEFGKVADVKLIDMQLCKYATPGIDIQTFLASSARVDIRENGYSNVIDVYRETFNSTLRKLNCNVRLSAEQLEEEIRFADVQGFFVICCLVPVIMAERRENSPELIEESNIIEDLDPSVDRPAGTYYGEAFRKVLITQLEVLESKGFFK